MSEQQDKHNRNIDALKALADGEDLQADPTQHGDAVETGPDAPWADEEQLVGGQEQEDAVAVDIEGLPAEADGLAARKARAATFHAQHRRVHAHQYKRTMIPLLLVVGAVLFILSGATMFMLLTGDGSSLTGSEAGQNLMMRRGAWLAVFAMPLGAILMVGAWLFHRDVTRAGPK